MVVFYLGGVGMLVGGRWSKVGRCVDKSWVLVELEFIFVFGLYCVWCIVF